MSLYAPISFGYLQQAEAYFLGLSRVGVMLSGPDVELLRRWRQEGVPIEVVCSGIRRGFDELEVPPRSLRGCKRFVAAELKAWTERHAGGRSAVEAGFGVDPHIARRTLHDPTRVREKVVAESGAPSKAYDPPYLTTWRRSVDRLIEVGRAAKDDRVVQACRWAYRRMVVLREEAIAEAGADDGELVEALALAIGQVEADLFQQVYEALTEVERARVDAALPQKMAAALRAMSPQARLGQIAIWRRRVLEDELMLRPFFVP